MTNPQIPGTDPGSRGNFNPNIEIDTSRTTSSGPPVREPSKSLLGVIVDAAGFKNGGQVDANRIRREVEAAQRRAQAEQRANAQRAQRQAMAQQRAEVAAYKRAVEAQARRQGLRVTWR